MITQIDGNYGAIWEALKSVPQIPPTLDIGGGQSTWEVATHVVDFKAPKTSATWINHDICDPKWAEQFPDKFFNFVLCNHCLEDLAYPIGALRIATRIARWGMFGTPHWTYEIGTRSDRPEWERLAGFPHHRWLVGINKTTGAYEFHPKYCWMVAGEYNFTQPNLNILWDGGDFKFADITFEYPGNSLRADLIAWLEARWL